MAAAPFTIFPTRTTADLEDAARLFRAYAASLGVDLDFQGFEEELASLPGKYALPAGEILLARDAQGTLVGCVALRPIEPEACCEMKRLYVAPEARGHGLGRALVRAIVAEASRIGYAEMRLDTIPALVEAIALYTQEGFVPIPAYYNTPLADTLFLGRSLLPQSL